LDRRVKELVGSEDVDYRFHTGNAELDRLVLQLRTTRSAARVYEARARRLTAKLLTLPAGGSARDLAVLVGLSYQRVHQLMQQGWAEDEVP
jgi:hypothetical protein